LNVNASEKVRRKILKKILALPENKSGNNALTFSVSSFGQKFISF